MSAVGTLQKHGTFKRYTFEGRITLANAVGRKNQDALEVLELSQEDRYKRIPGHVLAIALLKKHICFIKKQHRAPPIRQFQDQGQLLVNLFWGGPQLASADHVQWPSCGLCDGFCCQGLAAPGPTAKESDETLTFALDYIIVSSAFRGVLLDQRMNEGLLLLPDDQ